MNENTERGSDSVIRRDAESVMSSTMSGYAALTRSTRPASDTDSWIEKMPNYWVAAKIKHGFRTIGSGTTPPSNQEEFYGGEIPWVNTSELRENTVFSTEKTVTSEALHEFSALKIYPKNSVLFAMYGATIGRVAILGVEATVNQAVCVLSDSKKFFSRFVFYGLQSSKAILESIATGGGQPNLNAEKVKEHKLPCPPFDEQTVIADYLDRETAHIDALVAEKEKMLALLEEKRAALISRAVTRGLNPDAPLKPSGLDWLGDIPTHWAIRRCATLFQEIDERNSPDLPLLNVSLNTGVTLRVFSDSRIESVAADFATYKVARKGDLVFNKMRFWQGAAGIAPEDGLTSPDYTVARFSDELNAQFLEKLVRLPQFSNEVRRYSYGMVDDRLRLYWMEFRNLRIPIPPINEQHAIVAKIESESQGITELVSTLRQSISLAKERRAALIAAAVTGQIPAEELSA
jgi:type I restriction enzyme S subunit